MGRQTPWEELQVPGVVPLLQQINAGLVALTREVRQQQAAPPAQVPVRVPAPFGGAAVELPLTVKAIMDAAFAAGDTGDLFVYDNDYNITVPAGATVIQTFPTYGNPAAIIGDLTYVSDTVTFDGTLTIQVFVDGSPAAGPNATSALQVTTSTKSFGIAQYAISKSEAQIVVYNGTPGNVTMNFYTVRAIMSPNFYKNTVAPLLAKYGFSALTALLGGQ